MTSKTVIWTADNSLKYPAATGSGALQLNENKLYLYPDAQLFRTI
jgi:hypothetical protein